MKISQKQADLTVFTLDPRGARAPFAPPGYADDIGNFNLQFVRQNWTGSFYTGRVMHEQPVLLYG